MRIRDEKIRIRNPAWKNSGPRWKKFGSVTLPEVNLDKYFFPFAANYLCPGYRNDGRASNAKFLSKHTHSQENEIPM